MIDAEDSVCEEIAQTFENSGVSVELALVPLLSALNSILTGNLAPLKQLVDPEVKVKTMLANDSSTAEFKKTLLVDSNLLGCMLHTCSKKKMKLFWPFSYAMYHVKLTFHFVVAHATNEDEACRLQRIYEIAFENTISNAEKIALQQVSFPDAVCCSSTSSPSQKHIKEDNSENDNELIVTPRIKH